MKFENKIDSLKNKIIDELKKFEYKNQKLAVAVSGGIDSMTLLTCCFWAFGNNITAIYVDHKIRECNEINLIKEYAKKLKIKFTYKIIDVPIYSKEKKIGIEEAARFKRYEYLKSLNFDKIFLAHHKDDQKETILLNMLRGSGLTGLIGMQSNVNNMFIRPFLKYSKSDLIKIAKKYNIPYQHDYTNDDLNYNRNYIRHKVMPLLNKRFNTDAILKLSNIANETENYFFRLLKKNLDKINIYTPKLEVQLLQLDYSLASRYCYYALKKIGINNFTFSNIDNIIALSNKQSGRKFFLNEYKFQKEYDIIYIFNIKNNGNENKYNFNDYSFVKLKADKDLLGNCSWRCRREGDYFVPFGIQKKQSLKKYFITKKIPKHIRDNVRLLCSGNEVLVIEGIQISDRIKVTTKTKNIVYF